MTTRPTSVKIRMFDVGFGDCTLITFRYRDRSERHLLVDCGSTRRPYGSFEIDIVAKIVFDVTGGHLDAMIATHRHKDHVSGFGNADSAAIFDTLRPRLLIRPWTDHPDAPTNASSLSGVSLSEADRSFTRALRGTHMLAAAVEHELRTSRGGARGRLKALGEIGLPNKTAIDNLTRWSRLDTCRDLYVSAGDNDVDLGDEIPGVTLTVLGPPTLDQAPNLNSQRSEDPDEYWFRAAAKLANDIVGTKTFSRRVFTTLAGPDGFGAAAWLVNKLQDQSLEQLLRIVRTFDHAVNNTSIVALLNTGRTTMLISGDAQIENWQFTLDKIRPGDDGSPIPCPALRHELANVDLYKVGHHGSRNGTPISLHALWATERSPRRRFTTLLSTKNNVHGHPPDSEVPRVPLVNALRDVSTVVDTRELRSTSGNFRYWEATTRSSGSFRPFEKTHRYGRSASDD